jgi:hypothetical protein
MAVVLGFVGAPRRDAPDPFGIGSCAGIAVGDFARGLRGMGGGESLQIRIEFVPEGRASFAAGLKTLKGEVPSSFGEARRTSEVSRKKDDNTYMTSSC